MPADINDPPGPWEQPGDDGYINHPEEVRTALTVPQKTNSQPISPARKSVTRRRAEDPQIVLEGERVRLLADIVFRSGRRLRRGELGTVLRVPGLKPGELCQVRSDSGILFGARRRQIQVQFSSGPVSRGTNTVGAVATPSKAVSEEVECRLEIPRLLSPITEDVKRRPPAGFPGAKPPGSPGRAYGSPRRTYASPLAASGLISSWDPSQPTPVSETPWGIARSPLVTSPALLTVDASPWTLNSYEALRLKSPRPRSSSVLSTNAGASIGIFTDHLRRDFPTGTIRFVARWFNQADETKSHRLSRDECLQWLRLIYGGCGWEVPSTEALQEEVIGAFLRFDVGRDGYLGVTEACRYLCQSAVGQSLRERFGSALIRPSSSEETSSPPQLRSVDGASNTAIWEALREQALERQRRWPELHGKARALMESIGLASAEENMQ
eukprot:Hpha_TRINITY_DN27150_c0_g1::TRINITY_DN27150_c0_g1_i1::g.29267::m.29267